MFFGPPDRQLYGVYHPPARARADNAGVVLCYPIGQEYIRIHRAFRWLANQLAGQGFHVLRFDYSGQGDSAGDFGDARMAAWIEDARMAVGELVSAAGASQVDVVGLRAGTLVAAGVADLPVVRRLVLWEPRESGAAFRDELMAAHVSSELPPEAQVDEWGMLAIQGFAYSPSFLDDLAASGFPAAPARGLEAMLLVSAIPVAGLEAMVAGAVATGVKVDARLVDSPTNWTSIDDMGGLFLPMEPMRAIVEWLDAGR
ncbi:MAG TPA: alpha/beta hydrolase [Gemmatimonas sp.]|uniref:serine aminopeptidase domain-containing protein n=1 Tax=Gemmatimonas sp. TaxID=1962908 RepID=UPI002ED9DCFD